MLEGPQYRFPIFRVYTLYAVVTICSIISTLILWLEGIESKDIKTSIMEYDINHSVFDVACVCFGQGLLMLALVAYLEHTTLNAATKGQNPPVAIFKAIGFILTFGAVVFNIVKGGIILDKYINVDSQTLKFHNWYALCISCLVFSILQFAIYVKFLQHLKHLYGQFYVRMDNEEGEKSKEKPKVNLRRLMTLTYPERWKLMVGTIGLIGSTGSQMVAPLFFGYVIQRAAYGTMNELNKQILYLFLIYLGGAIAAFFRAWMYTLAGQSIVARLRRDLFKQIVSQEVAFFDLNRTGELINRLSSDTQVIQNALSVNISMLLRYTLQIIGSVIIMLVTSPRLAGVLIAVIPVVGISAQRYGAYIRNQQKIFQDELAVAATNAEETISSLRTIRAFSQEPRMCKEYDDAIHKSYQAGEKLSLAGGWFNMFIGIVTQGTIVLVLWYGGKLVNEHNMNVGELTSFILYALNVAMAFAFLSSLYGDFMKAVGASVRIFELLDRKSEIVDGSIVVKSGKTDIDFDEVTFNYPSRPDNKVLTGLTFKMRPGETIALVGPSGGGKSTVINMLERFYDPLTGRVLLGGEDIKDVNLSLFRKKMSIVSQEPVLFAKTIGQNISFGIEASQAQIEEAAKQANAHEFIQEFEDGYNTNVGERGVKLSGGQKQRVAIARALLMNPDILLLDEATSALDAESEHLVQEAIDRAMVGRTVLVIAHRLSTVRDATRVMVINKGRIAEQGTHDELLAANGVYKKLVLRQLEKGPQLKEVDDDGDVSSEDLLENSD